MPDAPAELVLALQAGARLGERWLVRPTSFGVLAGKTTALTGPNGSGKTTLLNMLLKRQLITEGSITLGAALGTNAASQEKTIAAMTGPPPFYSRLSVGEHLDLLTASWLASGGLAIPALEVLEVLELQRLLDQYPDELSSGERQGIGLAMAFARPAELLVLDEPEQRLDAARRGAIAALINRRNQGGTGVLVATHDPQLCELVNAAEVRLERTEGHL